MTVFAARPAVSPVMNPTHRQPTACPCYDPSLVLQHCETVDCGPRCHCCHSFSVLHSPHSNFNMTIATANDVLAICCKCHCIYVAAAVDFDGRGTLLSGVSINAAPFSSTHRSLHTSVTLSQSSGESQRTGCLLRNLLPFMGIDQHMFCHLVFSALVQAGHVPTKKSFLRPPPTWHHVRKHAYEQLSANKSSLVSCCGTLQYRIYMLDKFNTNQGFLRPSG